MTNEQIKDAFSKANQIRNEAIELEKLAVWAALEATHGVAAHAADLLGIERRILESMLRYRYRELGQRARTLRSKAGYSRGNPALIPGLQQR